MRKQLELNILLSPGTGVSQSCGIHKLTIHLFFQSVFWKRGLLICFSGVFVWAELPRHLSGRCAQGVLVLCVAFFPGVLLCLFRGSEHKWPWQDLWPRAARLWSPFNKTSRSNCLPFCVHQTHRLPQLAPTAILLGEVPGAPKHHSTFYLWDCKWLLAHVHSLLHCSQVMAGCCPTVLSWGHHHSENC